MDAKEPLTHITPYAVITLLNERYGVNRPTQMGYNYAKAGYLKTELVGDQRLVAIKVAEAWILKFAEKHNLKKVTQ